MSVKINMAGLRTISNRANDTICAQIAARVAAKVGNSTISTDPRTSDGDWAHTYVSTSNQGEYRTGELAKALGGAS